MVPKSLSFRSRANQVAAWFVVACALILGVAVTSKNAYCQDERFPDVLNATSIGLDAQIRIDDKENGELLLITDIPVKELLDLRRQQARSGKAFQFKKVQVEAVVKGAYAEVTGTFAVELGTGVRSAAIPLMFGTCQTGGMAPEITSTGTNSQFLADETGYRWILLANDELQPGAEHQIVLNGKSVVSKNSDRRLLRVSLPIHPTTIKVKLPKGATDIRLRSEDLLLEQEEVLMEL